MTPVTFEGDAPFVLPVVQSASALALGETVEMKLVVLIDGHPTPVWVPLIPAIADLLTTDLLQATADALSHKGRHHTRPAVPQGDR
jgi:hypothetical protein